MKKIKVGFFLLTALALPLTGIASTEVQASKNSTVAKKVTTKKGWVKDTQGTWYHYTEDGRMQRNMWIGDYYLGENGKMAVNRWVDGGKYYVGVDGKKTTPPTVTKEMPDKVLNNNVQNNHKKTGWQKDGNIWYHYDNNGTMSKNRWIGNYYLGSDGKMVTNSWVDNNRYYVGNDGAWVVGKKHLNGWVKENNAWYLYQNDKKVMNAWSGNYYLKADGKMATNE